MLKMKAEERERELDQRACLAFEIDVGRERENVERKRFHVNAGGERKRGEKVGRVI